ncbi:hypothetical protein D9757_009304 [Collybiopsis confluens]|uniref:Gpr1 family protein n=1 Tax=Collybiopsis confluens TaxID=2823264 RepID=A0A8H5M0D1_9AGAR|nr:hypothetical protein D9757_009304 [Collybiopsis confluens]
MSSTTGDAEKGRVEPVNNGTARDVQEYGNDPVSYSRYPTAHIANPGPVGLFNFAATTFILSLYNVRTRGITDSDTVIGMAVFGGGLSQFIAGMWEFPRGNVFGATAFTSYGAFWMSYALISLPGTGIQASYANPQEFANAFGIFLIAWFMITFFFLLAVLRRNIAFSCLLTALDLALLMLAIAEFTASPQVLKAGGVFGIITGLIAFYIAVSELLRAEDRAVVRLPLGVLHT